jgi:hypothetical protein
VPEHIPEALARALVALEEWGIPVAILRDFEADGSFVEIDLLVAPRHHRELTRALATCDFAPSRAWGHRGHRFYLQYSAADRLWVKLDLVSQVEGSRAELALASRRPVHGLPRLDPEVEAALLLLHCLVDKRGRLARHAARLHRVAAAGTAPPPGAPAALERLWPELETAVAGSNAIVPDATLRRLADALGARRARRVRRDRWLRRASYLRRALRPVAVTVAATDAELDSRELGPGARRVALPAGRGPLAHARRRLAVELERRRNDGPLVVDGGAGLAHADVTATPQSTTDQVNTALWRAYRRRLLG